jgi:hypothetical protein
MKKQLTDLRDTLDLIARDKERAAAARFVRRGPSGEVPREVYLAASETIADRFADLGFRYQKSGPDLVRKRRDWKEKVGFQSSMNNVSGQRVAIWVFGTVWNGKLKKWRRAHRTPFAEWGRVAGGQIGNLREPTGWVDWDLASEAARPDTVDDICEAIREIAIPYFDAFQDVAALHGLLLRADLPALDPKDAAELLLCYLGPTHASAYLRACLARHQDLWPAFREALVSIRAGQDLRNQYTRFAVQAAYLVTHYGLDGGPADPECGEVA